ncbi:MAG: hypothetical protein M1820_005452 [Bogoriella megaspora]|nr:MAG: hypothetical protein M1820_005452 [Bogoriella megaspora]
MPESGHKTGLFDLALELRDQIYFETQSIPAKATLKIGSRYIPPPAIKLLQVNHQVRREVKQLIMEHVEFEVDLVKTRKKRDRQCLGLPFSTDAKLSSFFSSVTKVRFHVNLAAPSLRDAWFNQYWISEHIDMADSLILAQDRLSLVLSKLSMDKVRHIVLDLRVDPHRLINLRHITESVMQIFSPCLKVQLAPSTTFSAAIISNPRNHWFTSKDSAETLIEWQSKLASIVKAVEARPPSEPPNAFDRAWIAFRTAVELADQWFWADAGKISLSCLRELEHIFIWEYGILRQEAIHARLEGDVRMFSSVVARFIKMDKTNHLKAVEAIAMRHYQTRTNDTRSSLRKRQALTSREAKRNHHMDQLRKFDEELEQHRKSLSCYDGD